MSAPAAAVRRDPSRVRVAPMAPRPATARNRLMDKYLLKGQQMLEKAGIKQDRIDKYRSENKRDRPDEEPDRDA